MKLSDIVIRGCYMILLRYLIVIIVKHQNVLHKQFNILYETFQNLNTGEDISNLLKTPQHIKNLNIYSYSPIIDGIQEQTTTTKASSGSRTNNILKLNIIDSNVDINKEITPQPTATATTTTKYVPTQSDIDYESCNVYGHSMINC